MASGAPGIDELIREYLIFRGFTSTLRAFEVDLKNDKDKAFRADHVVEQLQLHVNNFDITSLRSIWHHLDRRFFSRLENSFVPTVRKLETCLLRYYLIHCLICGRTDRVSEFFERYASELQSHSEWRDWFAIPFVRFPEQDKNFSLYFTKTWSETFLLSLHNFLRVIFDNMPLPTLLQFCDDRRRLNKMNEEIEGLRQEVRILQLQQQTSQLIKVPAGSSGSHSTPASSNPQPPQHSAGSERQHVAGSQRQRPVQDPASTLVMEDNFFQPSKDAKEGRTPQKAEATQPSPSTQHSTMSQGSTPAATPSSLRSMPVAAESASGSQRRLKNQGVFIPRASTGKSTKDEKSTVTEPAVLQLQAQAKSTATVGPNNVSADLSVRQSQSAQKNSLAGAGLNMTDSSDPTCAPYTNEDSPFIFLSQESYAEHHAAITNCQFAPGGSCIASSDLDGVVKVWMANPSRTVATVMSKTPVLSLEWMPTNSCTLLLGYSTGKVKLYDVNSKATVSEADVPSDYPRVISLACNPTGTCLAVACAGSASAPTSPSDTSSSHPRRLSSLLGGAVHFFSHSTSPFAVDASCGALSLWDSKTLKMEANLTLDPAPTCINCLAFNRSGNVLVAGSADGMIRVFDLNTNDCVVGWHGHMGQVYSIGFSHDESTLYSVGFDGKFCHWSIRQVAQKLAEVPLDTSAIAGLQIAMQAGNTARSPYTSLFRLDSEGEHILTSSGSQGVIYQLSDNGSSSGLQRVVTLRSHGCPVLGVDWSTALSCGTCLTSAQDGSIFVSTLLKK